MVFANELNNSNFRYPYLSFLPCLKIIPFPFIIMVFPQFFFHIFFLFFFLSFKKLINLCFGCVGSSLLHVGFLQLRQPGATLCCSVRASHCGGFSLLWSTGSRCAGLSSCGTWAQQLWRTGLVAPRHVGSSRSRDRTHVSCIGRQILNHCATREVPVFLLLPLQFQIFSSPYMV